MSQRDSGYREKRSITFKGEYLWKEEKRREKDG
jgi:hypothetical protein